MGEVGLSVFFECALPLLTYVVSLSLMSGVFCSFRRTGSRKFLDSKGTCDQIKRGYILYF